MTASNKTGRRAVSHDLRRQRAIEAIRLIRAAAVKNGTANMSMDEINSIIAEYRRERRVKRAEGT